MPPMVLNPPNNGSTQGTSCLFTPTNAHGAHPATSVVRWKMTVTTAQNNGGTLITQTPWSTQPISPCQVTNLPANSTYCWVQIIYDKPSGGPLVSVSNKFKSNR